MTFSSAVRCCGRHVTTTIIFERVAKMKEKANAFGVEEETKKERETAVSSSKIPSKEEAAAAAAVLRHIGRLC